MLAEMSGMEHVSLQPSAGAQGELTGLMLIRACLSERGDPRKNIIVPDTAHGTNPASSTLCGYDVIQISSNDKGVIDAAAVEKVMDRDVAAIDDHQSQYPRPVREQYRSDRPNSPRQRRYGLSWTEPT